MDYANELPENIVTSINNDIQTFIGHLNWLKRFDIANSENAKQEHDNFENQIDNFYNSIFNGFIINHLNFLRQELTLRTKNKKNLVQEQKELQQVRKRSEEIVQQLEQELNNLKKEKDQVESKRGEIAAVRFGKHFENEAKGYEKEAQRWLTQRDKFFKYLLRTVVANFVFYIILFITYKINWWPFLQPKEFFTIEYGLVNLALLSLLSYGVSFGSKNYNVNSNLEATNKHRKNVAETINDFLGSPGEKEDKVKILEQGTNAIFKHLPNGYLPKIDSKDDGPFSSILDTILRRN